MHKEEILTPIYIYLVKENILFLNLIKSLKTQSFFVWNTIQKVSLIHLSLY
ncbi:hypothetical protein ACO3TA_02910 [Methanocaldococcus sp. 28A]